MSNEVNQMNKERVWDFWQRMNHIEPDGVADLVRSAFHKDVDWNGSHPINQLVGVETLITDFYQPLLKSFPDLRRDPYVFMGGEDGGEYWVSATGYMTGTFVEDWLGIPATDDKTNIWFGQFFAMEDGKIAESYAVLDVLSVIRQAGFQVLPPARGAEGGKVPAPLTGDGILLTEQDELESRKTLQAVVAMLTGLGRYVRSRDLGDMRSMEQQHYWHPQMHWYGPSGIGACFTLEEFEDFHQRPWLHAFGDRNLHQTGGGRRMGFIGEGNYACGGIWDTVFSKHHGEFRGIPATGTMMSMRDFDWWRREGDLLVQNWVPIDLGDICMQMGVDLFERLHQQVEARKRGVLWYDAPAGG
jgi:predicted ester cyclase